MTGNVVILPARPIRFADTRSRDTVLKYLVPQMLGIIWDRGRPNPHQVHANSTARLDGMAVGGFMIHRAVVGLHAYVGRDPCIVQKVFSAHLADPSVIDGPSFKYLDGRCCILSWCRGEWEDQLMAQRTSPRTIAHVLTAGRLSRQA